MKGRDRILGRADGNKAPLTKVGLIEAIAAAAGITKRDAEVMVNTALAGETDLLLQAGQGAPVGVVGTTTPPGCRITADERLSIVWLKEQKGPYLRRRSRLAPGGPHRPGL